MNPNFYMSRNNQKQTGAQIVLLRQSPGFASNTGMITIFRQVSNKRTKQNYFKTVFEGIENQKAHKDWKSQFSKRKKSINSDTCHLSNPCGSCHAEYSLQKTQLNISTLSSTLHSLEPRPYPWLFSMTEAEVIPWIKNGGHVAAALFCFSFSSALFSS